ncbi:MAG: hypothetical protein CME71_06795 [Halobacteriovorax sp.]|nr:hypothetical protein [Halobacteriovorax sp.]
MKRILTLSIVLLVVTACGGKKVADTNISINVGALVAGSNPAGGVFITGTSGSDKFSMAVNGSNAHNIQLELPFGDWQFAAVAWLANGATGPMGGKTRCGVSSATIEGSDATISLNLTHAECASATFGLPAYHDTTSYPGETTFKKLELESCLNPVGVSTGNCDGSTLERLPGEHVSFKLAIPGSSSFGSAMPSLTSACFNLAAMNIGLVATEVRLPSGLGNRLPVTLIGYEKSNCLEESHSYVFAAGPGQTQIDKVQVDIQATTYRFAFADNYIGVTGSAFLHAHTNNFVKLPLITCTGSYCLQKGTNGPYKQNEFDDARRNIWNLFGSVDKNDPDDYTPSSESVGLINSSGASNVNVTTQNQGSLGNGRTISIGNAGPSGALSGSCSEPINITVYDTTLASDIATFINGCSANLIATGIDSGGTFNTGSITLTGGSDSLAPKRREDGEINRLKHMLIGPLGALLYKNGITTGALLCSSSGSYSLQLPDETVTLTLSGTTGSAVQPNFATGGAVQFEKKLTLSFNGVAEQAYYYNCNDAAGNDNLGVGAFVSYENDSGENSIQQVFWDVTTAGAEIVESNIQHTKNSYTYWKYDLFKKTNNADAFDYWSITGSNEYNYYRTLGTKSDGTFLYTYNVTGASSTDSTAMTVSVGSDTKWAITGGTFSAGAQTFVGNPGALMSTPSTAPSYSINDIVNNSTFWLLSY